jgi:hypothetical protein
MLDAKKNFWSCVSNCPAVCGGPILCLAGEHSSKAKVYQLYASLFVNHHVFRLDVSVDNVELLQSL